MKDGMKIRVNMPGSISILQDLGDHITGTMYIDKYVTDLLNSGITEDIANVIMYSLEPTVMFELVNSESKTEYYKAILTHIKLCIKLASIELSSKAEIIIESTLKSLF